MFKPPPSSQASSAPHDAKILPAKGPALPDLVTGAVMGVVVFAEGVGFLWRVYRKRSRKNGND